MGTELTVQQRAEVALNSEKARAELTAIAATLKGMMAPTNREGRDDCHSAVMQSVAARGAIAKAGKAAREDAVKYQKAIIAEEAELIGIIKPAEDKVRALRDEFDAKVEREKAAKAEAERLRVLDITTRIALFKSAVSDAARFDVTAEGAAEILFDVQSIEIDSTFSEFYGEAKEAQAAAMVEINKIVEAKRVAEVAAAKAEEERKAAEKLRVEAEAVANAKAEKEAAERAERERVEAAARKATQDKLDAELRAYELQMAEERQALDAARAKFEADQAEARAAEEAARKAQEAKDRAEQEAKDATARAELEKANAKKREAEEKERKRIELLTDKRERIIAIVEATEDDALLDSFLTAVVSIAEHRTEA